MTAIPVADPRTTRRLLAGLLGRRRWRVAAAGLATCSAAVAGLVLPATLGRIVEHSGLLRVGAELALDDVLTVGRAPENDLVLDDQFVSAVHARLERHGTAVTVADLGSTNGTFVNERPVRRADLVPGARLRIGETTFLYEA